MKSKVHSVRVGSGAELFFQHGLAANLNQITALLGELQDVTLSVIDCPGHGLSKMTPSYQPSFAAYADEVLQTMDQYGVDKAVVGGLSMGAGITLNIGLRYPDRVKGMILLRSAWIDESIPENLKMLLDASPLLNEVGGIDTFKSSTAFKDVNQQLELAGQSLLGIFGDHQQDCLDKVIQSLVRDRPLDSLEDLEKLDNIPTLIIGNDDDPLHPFGLSAILHEHIKGSVLEKVTSRYVEGALHKSQVQSLVSEFLRSI